MSDRDPHYDPVELLINATAEDTTTAAEWSALYDFHKIAEEWKKEKQTRENIVNFIAANTNLQPEFQAQLQMQAQNCKEKMQKLYDQMWKLARSEALEPVVWRAYERVCAEDAEIVRKAQEAEFQRKLQAITTEYQRKQQKTNIQATTHTQKANAKQPHSVRRKPVVWIFILFIFICFIAFALFKAYYEKGVKASYEAGYSAAIESTKETTTSFAEWSDAQHATEAAKPTLVALPMPTSGTILSGTEYNGSEITVTADSTSSYVVSLKRPSGIDVVSFFVRAGETVTVGVPAEYLYVYFAYGDTWYGFGKDLMFGPDTVYSKDDEMLDFSQYTWEYTLYPVYDGNFSDTPSDENEFFG